MLNRWLNRIILAAFALLSLAVGFVAFTFLLTFVAAVLIVIAVKLWWNSRRSARTLEGDYRVLVHPESPDVERWSLSSRDEHVRAALDRRI